MKEPTKGKILKAIWLSIASSVLIYGSLGALGYMAFFTETKENILLELKIDTLTDIGMVLFGFVICFSYPVIAFPIRKNLIALFFKENKDSRLLMTIVSLFIFSLSFVLSITLPGISFVFGVTGSTSGVMVNYYFILFLFLFYFILFYFLFIFNYLFYFIYFLFYYFLFIF